MLLGGLRPPSAKRRVTQSGPRPHVCDLAGRPDWVGLADPL